jgi:pyruvate dehydrogenase E2 component (dihydrolipoamide acetyltransferase)
MAIAITMPKLGNTVESSLLSKWHKSVGEHVSIGEVLFSCETDKAAFDQESEVEGIVLALLYKAGDIVPVFANICVIGHPGDDISMFLSQTQKDKSIENGSIESNKNIEMRSHPQPEQKIISDHSIVMTPRARQLAQKLGVNKDDCLPTGPKGRVIEMDVRRASVHPRSNEISQQEKPLDKVQTISAYREEKLSNIRKIIAKNMMLSLSSMAQLTHTTSFDCTKILAFRTGMKAMVSQGLMRNITINDMIIYAVSRVLKNHKDLNAHLVDNDTMRYFDSVNIGIATDTNRGLMVPTLFGADRLSLEDISEQALNLIKSAQSGEINPTLLSGGTFTISNLGSLGVEHFTPVINPPQTGILGVNTIETKVKIGKDGNIVPYSSMGLSLTYDHRAIDGAPASRFLKELKEYLEEFPVSLSVKINQ